MRASLIASTLLVSGLAMACGDPGGGMWAAWEVFEAPSGAYRLRYLDPPWNLVEAGGSEAYFEIISTGERLSPGSGAPPSYELRISAVAGGADRLVVRERRRALEREEEVLIPPRDVETASGDRGQELLTTGVERGRTRYFRYVFLDRPEGGSVSLRFKAYPELDDPEVDAMIASVEVDPPPEEAP